jgi:hypothetical protein
MSGSRQEQDLVFSSLGHILDEHALPGLQPVLACLYPQLFQAGGIYPAGWDELSGDDAWKEYQVGKRDFSGRSVQSKPDDPMSM